MFRQSIWYLEPTLSSSTDSALTLHQQIVNLKKPHGGHLDSLKEYMNRPSMGNIYFTGEDDEIWDVSSLDELVTMEPTTQDGITSSRSTVTLVKLYHGAIGRYLHVCSDTACISGRITLTVLLDRKKRRATIFETRFCTTTREYSRLSV